MLSLKKKNLLKLFLAPFLFAAGIGAVLAVSGFIAHQTDLARWAPENAQQEAMADIASGAIKIYIHGTYSAGPVGVGDEDWPLIANVRKVDAGVGCVVKYEDVFDMQRDYARLYNTAIVRHLRTQIRMQQG